MIHAVTTQQGQIEVMLAGNTEVNDTYTMKGHKVDSGLPWFVSESGRTLFYCEGYWVISGY